MKIRVSREADFNGVFLLLKQLWPDDKLSPKKTKFLFEKSLKDKKAVNLVAENNKQIIGYTLIEELSSLQSSGKVGIISAFVVDKKFRNLGVGSELLNEITKIAKRKRYVELILASSFKRKESHMFYEKSGFRKTSFLFWKKVNKK